MNIPPTTSRTLDGGAACPPWCRHRFAVRHPLAEDHTEPERSGWPVGTAEHERIFSAGTAVNGTRLGVELYALTTPDRSADEPARVTLYGLIEAANDGHLTSYDARALAAALLEAADVLDGASLSA